MNVFEDITLAKCISTEFSDNTLTILPTHICNYNCSYCFDAERRNDGDNRGKYISLEKLKEFFESYQTCGLDSLKLNILGGEPTLHPQIIDMFKLCASYSFVKSIRITSNGSAPKELYKELSQLHPKSIISITYHPSNPKGIEYYKELFAYLKDNNCYVEIGFLLDIKCSVEYLKELSLTLSEYGKVNYLPLMNTTYPDEYSQFIKTGFMKSTKIIKIKHGDGSTNLVSADDIIKLDYNPFANMKCDSFRQYWMYTIRDTLVFGCDYSKEYGVDIDSFKSLINDIPSKTCQKSSCTCWATLRKYK